MIFSYKVKFCFFNYKDLSLNIWGCTGTLFWNHHSMKNSGEALALLHQSCLHTSVLVTQVCTFRVLAPLVTQDSSLPMLPKPDFLVILLIPQQCHLFSTQSLPEKKKCNCPGFRFYKIFVLTLIDWINSLQSSWVIVNTHYIEKRQKIDMCLFI